MQRIHPESLQRLAEARMSGQGTAEIFKMLANAAQLVPDAQVSVSLGFQKPEDVYQEGDMVPLITLTLQPAVKITPLTESNDGPASSNSVPPGATGG